MLARLLLMDYTDITRRGRGLMPLRMTVQSSFIFLASLYYRIAVTRLMTAVLKLAINISASVCCPPFVYSVGSLHPCNYRIEYSDGYVEHYSIFTEKICAGRRFFVDRKRCNYELRDI